MDQPSNSMTLDGPIKAERTQEQLASIYAAMMEELGIGRMDTLPLEDRGHERPGPRVSTQPAHPRGAGHTGGVAEWNNYQPDDVPEAVRSLDSIADGQLARIRRGQISEVNQTSSTRGGHSSNKSSRSVQDGGRGSKISRGTQGKNARGRRGQEISSDGTHTISSPSITTTYLNDARRGINKHPRVLRAIELLRSAPPSQENQRPDPSRPLISNTAGSLSDPNVFFRAVGVGISAKSGNIPRTTPAITPNTIDSALVAATSYTPQSIRESASNGAALEPARTRSSAAATLFPVTDRKSAQIFANRSTGLASSRYAAQQPAQISRGPLDASPTLAPEFPDAKASNSNGLTPLSAPVPVSNDHPLALSASDASAASLLEALPSETNSTVSKSVNAGDISISGASSTLYEEAADAGRNGAALVPGKIKLVKYLDSIVLEFAEVRSQRSKKIYVAQWEKSVAGNSITFCRDTKEVLFTVGSDSYNVRFRFPHHRDDFKAIWDRHFTESTLKFSSSPNTSNAPAPAPTPAQAPHNKQAMRDPEGVRESSASTGQKLLFQRVAMASLNDGVVVNGKVRLLQMTSSLLLQCGESKDRDHKTFSLQWEQFLSVPLTFSVKKDLEVTISSGSDTYWIQFQLPVHTKVFEKLLQSHLDTTSSLLEKYDAKDSKEKRKRVVEEDFEHKMLGIRNARANLQKKQDKMIDRPAAETENTNSVEANKSQENRHETEPKLDSSASNASSSVVHEHMDEAGLASFDTHIPGSSSTFHTVTEDISLIDYSEEPPKENCHSTKGNSEIDDLLRMDGNHSVVAKMLEELNKVTGKSFLDDNRDIPADELLELAENFTWSRLNISAAFRKEVSAPARRAYAKDIASRTVELALNQDKQVISASDAESLPPPDNDISVYGDMSAFERKFGDYPQVNPSEQAGGSPDTDEDVKAASKRRQYSITELTELRKFASSINTKLPQPPTASKRQMMEEASANRRLSTRSSTCQGKSFIQSSSDQPKRPSKEELDSKYARPDFKPIFQGQASSDEKLPAHLSAIPPKSPQVIAKLEIPTLPPQQTHPASVDSIISLPEQAESSQVTKDPALNNLILSGLEPGESPVGKPDGSSHHISKSKDLTRLANEFADLKIAANQSKPTQILDQKKVTLLPGNMQGTSEKKKPAGLSSSRWVINSAPAVRSMQQFPVTTQQRQHFHTVSGLEVVGTVPVVAHRLVTSTTYSNNAGLQTFPQPIKPTSTSPIQETCIPQSFPPRSGTFDFNFSGSSTTPNITFFSTPPPTPGTARRPSPPCKVNIQATFKGKTQQAMTNRNS